MVPSSIMTGTTMSLRSPRRRRRSKFTVAATGSDSATKEQGSLLWTILLIGLVFCLADVAYILHYVDTQHDIISNGHGHALGRYDQNHDDGSLNNGNQQEQQESPKDSKKYPSLGGLNLEEYRVMDNQLHRHEVQIYNQQQVELLQNHKQLKEPVETTNPLSDEEWALIRRDKKHILDMLVDANIKPEDLDPQTLRDLPTWKEVTDLYGDEPRIYGLDQCQVFQEHSDRADHFVSTAGTFNSGTNLMAELLIANCHMQDRMDKFGAQNRGIRWQVPWGKHTPPGDEEFRTTHKTLKDADVDANNILPAVTIRDPYVWMLSMCRHEYAAHWHHDPDGHCPNLIPDEQDLKDFSKWLRKGESVKVHVKYNGFWKHHDSLVGMWNDWYREYVDINHFSRIIVRYEDLLFHPRNVTETVCKCAGGRLRKDGRFEYVTGSAKKGPTAHGPMELRTGFVKAMIKYGKAAHRNDGFTADDLAYAKEHLDREMMDFFRYKHPDELTAAKTS